MGHFLRGIALSALLFVASSCTDARPEPWMAAHSTPPVLIEPMLTAGAVTSRAELAPVLPATATETVRPTATAKPRSTSTPLPMMSPTTIPTFTPSPTATLNAEPTPDGVVRSLRVPILMYHYVSEPPPGSDVYRQDLSVSPERFAAHLQYLAEAGYTAISLDDLLFALTQGSALPERPVLLTFDDGYEDNYTNAFPLLQHYSMAGNFFIITDFASNRRVGYLTWDQIKEMAAAGHHFGSHSRDHPDLRKKSLDYLVWQALGGKEAIEERLGYHPRWIAYPSGGYDAQVIAVYKSAGYWGGLTTRQGATHTADGLFELRRVRVRGSHTAEDLAALLDLDW
jgi:peptidoglycan/xylan/chitin deacetylase (PgdA/CDA1 family)